MDYPNFFGMMDFRRVKTILFHVLECGTDGGPDIWIWV